MGDVKSTSKQNIFSEKKLFFQKAFHNLGYSKYSFNFAHWFFGRTLGFVTLIAFLSYWVQADSLIGANGINPWTEDLEKIEALTERNPELSKFSLRPTLLWFPIFSSHHLALRAWYSFSNLAGSRFPPNLIGIFLLHFLSISDGRGRTISELSMGYSPYRNTASISPFSTHRSLSPIWL